MNFTASIGNKLFLGTFNCNFPDLEEWKIIVLQMIYTLKDLTKDSVKCAMKKYL